MANTVAGILLTGDHASRPAGNAVPDGTLYSCTTHSLIYHSNYAGNSWATWASLTGSGFANPMANKGEMIVGDTAGAASALTAGTAGYLLTAAGAGNFPAWAAPVLTTVHLTANETGKTDANLVNTGLSFAVTNAVYYAFRFYLVWDTSSTTVLLKVGLTTPTFTVFTSSVRIIHAPSGSVDGELQGTINASGGSITNTASTTTSGTDLLASIEGVLLPSADGTLMLQYAAETTGATVTLKKGSSGELVRLA